MKRLNGMDAMLLYSETPNLHTHTLKVAIINAADFDGEFRFDVFRRTIQRRSASTRPVALPARRYPVEAAPPDVAARTARSTSTITCAACTVPSPGGRRELDQVIGQIASTPLDRGHPLWEFHFAEGMADDRFALIGKVHHTLADGVASANLLARLMDLAGSVRGTSATTTPPAAAPVESELLKGAMRDHVTHVAALPAADPRMRLGVSTNSATHQGAQRSSRPGEDVQDPTDVSQPRGVTGADVRHGVGVAGRSQGDGQATRRDVQRHRAGHGGGRACANCCCATTVARTDR